LVGASGFDSRSSTQAISSTRNAPTTAPRSVPHRYRSQRCMLSYRLIGLQRGASAAPNTRLRFRVRPQPFDPAARQACLFRPLEESLGPKDGYLHLGNLEDRRSLDSVGPKFVVVYHHDVSITKPLELAALFIQRIR